MFGLVKPYQRSVGVRIIETREYLGCSYAEFASKLGLEETTVLSYAGGYSLAPFELLQKLSILTGKSVGWFYFGEVEEYIEDYLLLKDEEKKLEKYPTIPHEIYVQFIIGNFDKLKYLNDFGFSTEEFIDNVFNSIEYYLSVRKCEYIKDLEKYKPVKE